MLGSVVAYRAARPRAWPERDRRLRARPGAAALAPDDRPPGARLLGRARLLRSRQRARQPEHPLDHDAAYSAAPEAVRDDDRDARLGSRSRWPSSGPGRYSTTFGPQLVLVAWAVQTAAMLAIISVHSREAFTSRRSAHEPRPCSRWGQVLQSNIGAVGLQDLTPRILRARPAAAARCRVHLGARLADDVLALPWFVLVTTGSAARMGVVLGVQLLPVALLGLPSGSLIGRIGARRTLILCDAGRAPLMLSIPLLPLGRPALLRASAGDRLRDRLLPGALLRRSAPAGLLGDDERAVAQGNAVLEGVQRVTSLAGPSAAGVLIAVLDAPSVLSTSTPRPSSSRRSSCASSSRRPPVEAARDEASRGLLVGLVSSSRTVCWATLSAGVVVNLLGQMLAAALPVLAYESYGAAAVSRAHSSRLGVGAVLGSVAAVKVLPRVEPIRLGASRSWPRPYRLGARARAAGLGRDDRARCSPSSARSSTRR